MREDGREGGQERGRGRKDGREEETICNSRAPARRQFQ